MSNQVKRHVPFTKESGQVVIGVGLIACGKKKMGQQNQQKRIPDAESGTMQDADVTSINVAALQAGNLMNTVGVQRELKS